MIDMSNANVVRQEEVIAIDKPTLKPYGVINKVNETLSKQVVERKTNSQSRPPLTEEQRKRIREVQSRTVFIDGHRDEIRKYFKHMPRQLNKEIIDKTRGELTRFLLPNRVYLRL